MDDVKQRYLRVIKSIDFSKEFSSWFAQMPIRDVPVSRGSMEFSTTGPHDLRSLWKMRFEICVEHSASGRLNEYAPWRESVLADGVKFELESDTSVALPIIYRMVITGKDGRELLELCDFQVFSPNGYQMKKMYKRVHFAGSCAFDKLANFQLWIFVPNDLGICSLPPFSLFGKGLGVETLFRSVMAEQRNVDDDETEDSSDVDLVLVDADGNECRRYPCHRANLGAASSVFQRLLFLKRPASEATSDSTAGSSVKRAFNMHDINEEAMNRLLEFIYLGHLPKCTDDFDDESLFQLINAAEEKNLPVLKEGCEFLCILRLKSQYIDPLQHDANHLHRYDPNGDPGSNRNALKMLSVAELYTLDRLKAVCIRLLSANITWINKKREEGLISNALFAEMIAFYQKERGKVEPAVITWNSSWP